MLELIIGIVLGAAFHEFWNDIFQKIKAKISEWTTSAKDGKEQPFVAEPSFNEATHNENKPTTN